jgi:hypothetical protein
MPRNDLSYLDKVRQKIDDLRLEIQKWEDVYEKLSELEGVPMRAVAAPRVVTGKKRGRKPGWKPGRGPGRPPLAQKILKKRGRKPGPKPGLKRGPGRPVARRAGKGLSTADVMADLLRRMDEPTIDELADKLHAAYPKMGGVKYRSVVASIISRDPRFQKRGNRVRMK